MHTFNGVGAGQFSQLGELLEQEREQLQAAITDLDREIANIRSERQEKEERLEHIEALLGLERPERVSSKAGTIPRRKLTPATALLDMAAAVLREREKEPMYYKELAAALIDRGAVIGGKDAAASLVARMTTDARQRFVRPTSKGFYALREDYPAVKRSVGARRKKRNKTKGSG